MSVNKSFVKIARSTGGVSNTKLKNWSPSFSSLCDRLSKPSIGDKDGSYYVRGPVNDKGVRSNENIRLACLVLLDGDKTISLDTGEITEGAPPPRSVHRVLRDLNIQHAVYTTHSHGSKGNRYRVAMTADRPIRNAVELRACVDYVMSLLHEHDVPLNSVSENYTWAQPWYFPRLASEKVSFEFYAHEEGVPINVDECIEWAKQNTVVDRKVTKTALVTPRHKQVGVSNSVIAAYNAQHGNSDALLKYLSGHGYKCKGQTQINGKGAYRLLSPGSTSGIPGVVVYTATNGTCRVCSHHGTTSDPLAQVGSDGKVFAHDAFDIYRLLEHNGDISKALAAITPPKPELKVAGGSLAKNVRQAIRLLGKQTPPVIFQRGSILGRVAHLPKNTDVEGCAVPEGTAVIMEVGTTDLAIHLCDVAEWKKPASPTKTGGMKWVRIDPPPKVAKGILVQQGKWGRIPVLKGIAETPILRSDGSIFNKPGYDHVTGLYYEGGCPVLDIPKRPSFADARLASKAIRRVFAEFPFVEDKTDFAVILAYIFTLVLRGQIPLAPLFAVSATTPGSGKGLLVEVVNVLVRGHDAAIMPPVSSSGADEEMRKRITALLLQGLTSINLDNLATPIGGEALNGLLTATEWTDRILGQSKTVKLPNQATWAATGNNLVVRGDMVRRTLLIQMDPKVERPELREFKVRDLIAHVLSRRAELLSAVFTILKAYAIAGQTNVDGTPLGRFEAWWHRVCSPIIWLGFPDPVTSQERLRIDDPETAKLGRLLDAWYRVFNNKSVFVSNLDEVVNEAAGLHGAREDLKEALMECAGDRGNLNNKTLGWFLRRFNGRVVHSYRLVRIDPEGAGKPRYRVERA